MSRRRRLHRHIFACFHGLGGTARDFLCIGNSLVSLFNACFDDIEVSDTAIIFSSESYEDGQSRQSISDVGRLCSEEFINWFNNDLEKTSSDEKFYFSVIAHSLGGLIARNTLGQLFFDNAPGEELLTHLIPVTFLTMNCPHLGTRAPGSGKHIRLLYKSFVWLGRKIISENFIGVVGKELMLKDKGTGTGADGERLSPHDISQTILYRMTDPESCFMRGVELFRHKVLVGCTRNDHLVPYASALIQAWNPWELPRHTRRLPSVCSVRCFSGWGEVLSKRLDAILRYLGMTNFVKGEDEPDLIRGTRLNPFPGITQSSGWQRDNIRRLKFDLTMLERLQQVEWKRVAVEYQTPRAINNFNLHTFTLGSWFNGRKEMMLPAATAAVKVVIHICLLLHRETEAFVKKSYRASAGGEGAAGDGDVILPIVRTEPIPRPPMDLLATPSERVGAALRLAPMNLPRINTGRGSGGGDDDDIVKVEGRSSDESPSTPEECGTYGIGELSPFSLAGAESPVPVQMDPEQWGRRLAAMSIRDPRAGGGGADEDVAEIVRMMSSQDLDDDGDLDGLDFGEIGDDEDEGEGEVQDEEEEGKEND